MYFVSCQFVVKYNDICVFVAECNLAIIIYKFGISRHVYATFFLDYIWRIHPPSCTSISKSPCTYTYIYFIYYI